jgi:hypothetical protein
LSQSKTPTAGASLEIPEIFPEIPDFPETLEKSPEYPGFTDKIVLSGDFQESPIHPPTSRRHQDPFNWYQSLVLRFELNRLELKGCRLHVRYRLSPFGLTAQTTLLGMLMFFMYYILRVLHFNELWRLVSFPRILIVRTHPIFFFEIKGRSAAISFKKKQQITSRAEAKPTTHKQRTQTTHTTRHYTTSNWEKSQRSHHNLAPSSPTLCHGQSRNPLQVQVAT